MKFINILLGVVSGLVLSSPGWAQAPPSNAELLRRIEQMQARLDQLEGRNRPPPSPKLAARRLAAAPVAAAAPARANASAPPSPVPAATDNNNATLKQPESLAGLLPPEPMGTQIEDALRSDLPGISMRVPGTNTQVRFYGFAKLSAYKDFDGRNQTDAPPPQTIPLSNGPAAKQGGDFGMTGRFSRFGVDTRTLTEWGTLETRLEGDFGGGAATSSNATFRLRQAWGELGTNQFRVLAGQANSLWNEGLFETLIDATNLNQSFIRQAQIRATGQLAPGVLGQVSLEAPETQYTSVAGVFTPGSTPDGGASPAFNALPDFLGRLTYTNDGLEIGARAMVRQLSLRTSGTSAAPQGVNLNTIGSGGAVHVRLPMRWLFNALGPDELLGMGFYGQGISRYFAGNTSGQDALSNIGLPGTSGNVALTALPAYGVIAAYRRFWTAKLRTNVSYSYAWQQYPSYALGFTPGSASAVSLNRNLQQVFVNLIWSPFAELRGDTVGTGWVDIGIEYLFTRRDLFGGSTAAGASGSGQGIANRVVVAAIARF